MADADGKGNGHGNGNGNGNGHYVYEGVAASATAAAAAGFGEERVAELRALLGKADGDALRIVGIGAGAWGSVFIAMLQDAYGSMRDSVQVSGNWNWQVS
jgi:hypothetical protein